MASVNWPSCMQSYGTVGLRPAEVVCLFSGSICNHLRPVLLSCKGDISLQPLRSEAVGGLSALLYNKASICLPLPLPIAHLCWSGGIWIQSKVLRDGGPRVCQPASFPWCLLLQNAALLPPLLMFCKLVALAMLLRPLCTQGFSPERRRMQKSHHPGRKHCLCLGGCQTMGYAHPTAAKAIEHSTNITWIAGSPKS